MAAHAARIVGVGYKTSVLPPPRKPMHRVVFGCRDAVARLVALGLTERKSLTCGFPDALPLEMVPHFVRGFFDGNGCVIMPRNPSIMNPTHEGRLASSFVGAYPVLEGIKRALHAAFDTSRHTIRKKGSVWTMTFNHQDSLNLASYMYGASGPHLRRKAEVFSRGIQVRGRVVYKLPSPIPAALLPQ